MKRKLKDFPAEYFENIAASVYTFCQTLSPLTVIVFVLLQYGPIAFYCMGLFSFEVVATPVAAFISSVFCILFLLNLIAILYIFSQRNKKNLSSFYAIYLSFFTFIGSFSFYFAYFYLLNSNSMNIGYYVAGIISIGIGLLCIPLLFVGFCRQLSKVEPARENRSKIKKKRWSIAVTIIFALLMPLIALLGTTYSRFVFGSFSDLVNPWFTPVVVLYFCILVMFGMLCGFVISLLDVYYQLRVKKINKMDQ